MNENQLIETGSQMLTATDAPPEELKLVASDGEQMKLAQAQLVAWFEGRVERCRADLKDAEDMRVHAAGAGVQPLSFTRNVSRAKEELTYYEKMLAAVRDGYVIVPNFPVAVFAVRRERWQYSQPLGEGEWENASTWAPDRRVQFPMHVARPEILSETKLAMQRKVFDDLCVLPEAPSDGKRRKRRRRAVADSGDPMVIGRIYTSERFGPQRMASFLLAWYVDTREL